MSEKKIGETETEVTIGNRNYTVKFEYGIAYTDGDEKEYPWAEVIECYAELDGKTVFVRIEDIPQIESHCAQLAAEALGFDR